MSSRRNFLKSGLALGAVAIAGPAFAGGHGRLGTFTGASNHVTTGTAEIAGRTVTLLDDFTFDGAPDPKVSLGKDGHRDEWILAPLQSNSGEQSYAIPANIDLDSVNEVWIWCEKFNVPLGVAKLN